MAVVGGAGYKGPSIKDVRTEGGDGPMRTDADGGGVRGHADVRKSADNSGQIRSKSYYLGCQNCVLLACKHAILFLQNNNEKSRF